MFIWSLFGLNKIVISHPWKYKNNLKSYPGKASHTMEAPKTSIMGLPSKAVYGLLILFAVLFATSISGNIYLFATKGKPNLQADLKGGETQKPQKVIEIHDLNLESLKNFLANDQADGETAITALIHMQDLDQAHIKLLEPNFHTSNNTIRLFRALENAILEYKVKLSTVFKASVDPSAFELLKNSDLNYFFKFIDPSLNLQGQVNQLKEENEKLYKLSELQKTELSAKIDELENNLKDPKQSSELYKILLTANQKFMDENLDLRKENQNLRTENDKLKLQNQYFDTENQKLTKERDDLDLGLEETLEKVIYLEDENRKQKELLLANTDQMEEMAMEILDKFTKWLHLCDGDVKASDADLQIPELFDEKFDVVKSDLETYFEGQRTLKEPLAGVYDSKIPREEVSLKNIEELIKVDGIAEIERSKSNLSLLLQDAEKNAKEMKIQEHNLKTQERNLKEREESLCRRENRIKDQEDVLKKQPSKQPESVDLENSDFLKKLETKEKDLKAREASLLDKQKAVLKQEEENKKNAVKLDKLKKELEIDNKKLEQLNTQIEIKKKEKAKNDEAKIEIINLVTFILRLINQDAVKENAEKIETLLNSFKETYLEEETNISLPEC
jgi:hypothetical protein